VAAPRTARSHGDFELRQLIGYRREAVTNAKVVHKTDLDEVLRNGRRIGYIARHTGAPFTPIVRLSSEERDDAIAAIDAIRAADGRVGPSGRKVAFPDAATDEVIQDVVRRQRAALRGDDPDEDTEGVEDEDNDGLIDDQTTDDDELDLG